MTGAAKVDVILPTRNQRGFLPRALRCVCNQTFGDWRLLVVNDGGEDVADVIGGFHDPRILYFSRPHAGKAAQLNYALGQVTAPYVSYMDDDDEVFPEHLEKLLSAAERIGADFVYSDTYLTILDSDGKLVLRTVENTEDAPYDSIRIFNRINHKQVLHARELIDRVGGYDEEMRILIDFDCIKRMAAAARRPFHLREVTGEHFQRMDLRTGEVASISGLWKRDPVAAGRSLLRLFSKDPAALAELYCSVHVRERELARSNAKSGCGIFARCRRLLARERGTFYDALPPDCTWRASAPAGGIGGFFRMADETFGAIAAANRITAGEAPGRRLRSAWRSSAGFPPSVPAPRFRTEFVEGGLRFVHAAGTPMRWIMLTTAVELPEDFALEFDYLPHAAFREQLQVDFRMSSLGDRIRFLVRDNAMLAMNAVEGGRLLPDGRTAPFSFRLGVPARVRIESCEGVHSFSVDGKSILSMAYEGPAGRRGRFAALVFYDSDPEKTIDFEIRNLRTFVRA